MAGSDSPSGKIGACEGKREELGRNKEVLSIVIIHRYLIDIGHEHMIHEYKDSNKDLHGSSPAARDYPTQHLIQCSLRGYQETKMQMQSSVGKEMQHKTSAISASSPSYPHHRYDCDGCPPGYVSDIGT